VFNFINKYYAEDMTPEEIKALFNFESDLVCFWFCFVFVLGCILCIYMFIPKLLLDLHNYSNP
jgi:hypothetical protein